MVFSIYAASSGIYLAKTGGSEPILLFHHRLSSGEGYPIEPLWSPDSQHLLFVTTEREDLFS